MATITFVSRMTCKSGKQSEFIRLCRRLENYVKAEEPDTILFGFYKLREPNRYVVLESFRSEEAEHRHMNSKMLADIAPQISGCLEGTWVREYFDPLD